MLNAVDESLLSTCLYMVRQKNDASWIVHVEYLGRDAMKYNLYFDSLCMQKFDRLGMQKGILNIQRTLLIS